MTQITLKNISRSFPAARGTSWKAVDDVSLEIKVGEIVGMLGPSGCGKSTLLNIVAGLDEGYEGSFTVQGRSLKDQLAAGFRMAYVFQEPRLLPWKTVRENIEFVLEAAEFPRSQWREKTDRVLDLVELTRFADFRPMQLCGGMQQRASIARAFAIEPDILLMDEPFSALDELTARRLRQSLLNIWQSFRSTILFVSHNALEATFLGDRVLVMSRGPAGRIREEIDLGHLSRPRMDDDDALFQQSKAVVRSLSRYAGRDTDM